MNFIQKTKVGSVYTKYNFKNINLSNFCLIRWSPETRTKIHNHDGKNCMFISINGPLHECRYLHKHMGSLYRSQTIKPLSFYDMKSEDGFHQMFNFDKKVKYSIHRYYD